MSNYKIELERTEKQDLEIKKHISDVKDIVKNKVNKNVNGLNSIKELLENETLGGYIVGDIIKIDNLEKALYVPDFTKYNKVWEKTTTKALSISVSENYIYLGGWTENIVCMAKDSNVLWGADIGYIVNKVIVNKKGDIICGANDYKTHKVSEQGQVLWSVKSHEGAVTALAVDADNNIYSGSGSQVNTKLVKLDDRGNILKSIPHSRYIKDICYGIDNKVYVLSADNILSQYTSELELIWTIKSVESIVVNDYDVFIARGGVVCKLSENGEISKSISLGGGGRIARMDVASDNSIIVSSESTYRIHKDLENTLKLPINTYNCLTFSSYTDDDIYVSWRDAIYRYVIKRDISGYKVLKVERG